MRLALELLDEPVDDALVEVFAAEEGVAAGGAHLEEALGHFQDRDIEGAAAQVVDGDVARLVRLEAVGQRRGRGLVDDAFDLEAGDFTGVLGRLALRVVEVGGHRDDRAVDRLAEVVLGGGLQLLQDEGRHLRRGIEALLDLDVGVAVGRLDDAVGHEPAGFGRLGRVELAADEALHREHGVLRVGEGLALGDLAHEPLALGGERHDRGRGARAFLVGDDGRDAALHDRHAGVGRAEIDADHSSQGLPLILPPATASCVPCPSAVSGRYPFRSSRPSRARAGAGGPSGCSPSAAPREWRRRGAGSRLMRQRLVAVRVELLAVRLVDRQAARLQHAAHLLRDHLDAGRAAIVGALGAEGAIEVVEDRDEVAKQRGRGVVSRPAGAPVRRASCSCRSRRRLRRSWSFSSASSRWARRVFAGLGHRLEAVLSVVVCRCRPCVLGPKLLDAGSREPAPRADQRHRARVFHARAAEDTDSEDFAAVHCRSGP